jgi:hypothetical protein
MKRIYSWMLRTGLRFLLTGNDYACFKEAWKCAEETNSRSVGLKYIGAVKHLLSVNRSIRKMVQDGRDRDEITAALVHLAVSLKYLESRNEQRADI